MDENANNYRLSQIPLTVPGNSFLLLAADSLVIIKYGLDESVLKSIVGVSSLGLVNTGELILLKDVKGNIIDSVWYSDKWHNDNFGSTKNISLERINPNLGANDPSNWSSSVNSIGAGEGFEMVSEILIPYTINLHIKDFAIFRAVHKMGFTIEPRTVNTKTSLLEIGRFVAHPQDKLMIIALKSKGAYEVVNILQKLKRGLL